MTRSHATCEALQFPLNTKLRDWGLRLLLVLLWPIFWLQGKPVRRVTPRMPEATGSREGSCGHR